MIPPTPLPLHEAQARLLDNVTPLGAETIAAEDAAGRYIAQALSAQRTQPAADLSAMDGYAVRADDLAGPWSVVGESAAGHPFQGLLGANEAVRISTGALMPQRGGAVLLQENAVRDGAVLALGAQDGPTPRHIRRKGFDFRDGDALIGAGALLNPARIALALSGGHAQIAVGKRPSIAIVDSGDELAVDPASLAAHQIPASNAAMLAAMSAHLVRDTLRLGPVADRMDRLLAAFDKAGDANVIVTSGGASVGDHDLVRPALEEWGARIDFWRIAMKPGKPLMVARKGDQYIVGLPGNPVSSFVTAYLFVLPFLRKLAGAAAPVAKPFTFPLAGDLPETGKRAEFFRAVVEGASVSPLMQRDSSALASLSAANGLIFRQPHQPSARSGDLVEVYLLQNGGIA